MSPDYSVSAIQVPVGRCHKHRCHKSALCHKPAGTLLWRVSLGEKRMPPGDGGDVELHVLGCRLTY